MKLKLISLTLIIGLYPSFSMACDIILLGDSISSGYGITPEKKWAELLSEKINQKHPNARLLNLSVSGYTSKLALEILKVTLKKHQANIIIVEIGGNDALRGIGPDAFAENMSQIERLAANQNATMVVLGVRLPPNIPKAYREAHAMVYQKLIEKHPGTMQFMDDVIAKDLFQTDRIHPDETAQTYLLQRAWPAIEQALTQQKARCPKRQ